MCVNKNFSCCRPVGEICLFSTYQRIKHINQTGYKRISLGRRNFPTSSQCALLLASLSHSLKGRCNASVPVKQETEHATLSASSWKSSVLKQLGGMLYSWFVSCLNHAAALGCWEAYRHIPCPATSGLKHSTGERKARGHCAQHRPCLHLLQT